MSGWQINGFGSGGQRENEGNAISRNGARKWTSIGELLPTERIPRKSEGNHRISWD